MINLSIIIPHYNSVTLLVKLLDSIPNSNEIQVIVVDDNSDYKNKKLLSSIKEKYASKNIEVHENSGPKGAGTCRNIGIKHAKGKWLLFADADDYFTSSFYEKVSKYFTQDYDVVFFRPTSIELDTGKISNRHIAYEKIINSYLNLKNKHNEYILRYFFHVPWSKLVKKQFILDKNIEFEEVLVSNDIVFSAKVGHSMRRFNVSTEVIYCVTRTKGSLTTIINYSVFEIRLREYIKYYNFLKNNLGESEFKSLKLSGRGFLIRSFDYGTKKAWKVYRILRRNGIPVIEFNALNPVKLINRLKDNNRRKKSLEKYYHKKE